MEENKTVVQIVDDIIDAIQRGDDMKLYAEESKQRVDAFLRGESPEDEDRVRDIWRKFAEKINAVLPDTVNQCIRARKGWSVDDLKQYKEGYFNEIVQNANDVARRSELTDPQLDISISKEPCDDPSLMRYRVCCEYPDQGFTMENIYGFCTRGNSDKVKKPDNVDDSDDVDDSDNTDYSGETKRVEGAFGIGIKSIFCFAEEFHIESNIKLDITSVEKPLDSCCLEKAKNWNGKTTKLKFAVLFRKPEVSGNIGEKKTSGTANKHAGFNTKKLEGFIDAVHELSEAENGETRNKLKKHLWDGKDGEMLFDLRALLFTELRGAKNFEGNNTGIKTLVIRSGEKEVCRCTVQDTPVQTDGALVKMSEISFLDECTTYMTFHFPEDNTHDDISLAFQYEQDAVPADRLYATYFVKSDRANKSGEAYNFLGEQCGCLINITKINSSRSGLKEDSKGDMTDNIMTCGRYAVKILSGLASGSEDGARRRVSSDILHRLLWINRLNHKKGEEDDLIPMGIFKGYLELAQKDCLYLGDKVYVINREDDVDDEAEIILKNLPTAADRDRNPGEVYQAYQKYFRKNDGIRWHTDGRAADLPVGIRSFIDAYFNNDEDTWIRQLDYPLMQNVEELIRWRIGGNRSDIGNEQIDRFLPEDQEDRILVKQLLSRFEVTDLFDYMGAYCDKNIRSWLFGQVVTDPEFKKTTEDFQNFYKELKEIINQCQCKIYYSIPPRGYTKLWNYDKIMSEPEKEWKNEWKDEKKEKAVMQLMSLLNEPLLFTGCYRYEGYPQRPKENDVFVHSLRNGLLSGLWNRPRRCSFSEERYFYLLKLSNLEHTFTNFDRFKCVREALDIYNDIPQRLYCDQINNWNCCELECADADTLRELFGWLAVYREADKIEIKIKDCLLQQREKDDIDKNSALIEFLKMFIGDDVDVRLEELIELENGKKKYLGCLTNLTANETDNKKTRVCIRQASTGSWKDFAPCYDTVETGKKYLLIYYSNTEAQKALAEVIRHINVGGVSDEVCTYIERFIRPGNTRYVSEDIFNRYRKLKKPPDIQYPFLKREWEPDELCWEPDEGGLNMENIYRILSENTSYDDYCPLCGTIPTLNVRGEQENLSRMEKKNCMVVMFPAQYGDKKKKIFVQTFCCKSCFEEYKNTLTCAEVTDVGEGRKKLILKKEVCSQRRRRNYTSGFMLSPNHWEIIKWFNKGRIHEPEPAADIYDTAVQQMHPAPQMVFRILDCRTGYSEEYPTKNYPGYLFSKLFPDITQLEGSVQLSGSTIQIQLTDKTYVWYEKNPEVVGSGNPAMRCISMVNDGFWYEYQYKINRHGTIEKSDQQRVFRILDCGTGYSEAYPINDYLGYLFSTVFPNRAQLEGYAQLSGSTIQIQLTDNRTRVWYEKDPAVVGCTSMGNDGILYEYQYKINRDWKIAQYDVNHNIWRYYSPEKGWVYGG